MNSSNHPNPGRRGTSPGRPTKPPKQRDRRLGALKKRFLTGGRTSVPGWSSMRVFRAPALSSQHGIQGTALGARSLVHSGPCFHHGPAQRLPQAQAVLRNGASPITVPPSVLSGARSSVKIEKKEPTQTLIPDLPFDDSFGKAKIKVDYFVDPCMLGAARGLGGRAMKLAGF